MTDLFNYRWNVRGCDRVGAAGRAIDDCAGTPILARTIGQRGIDQFECLARAVMLCKPFPAHFSKRIGHAEPANRPVTLICKDDVIYGLAGGVFEPNLIGTPPRFSG